MNIIIALEHTKLYIMMAVIHYYLERDNDKVFKYHMNKLFSLLPLLHAILC